MTEENKLSNQSSLGCSKSYVSEKKEENGWKQCMEASRKQHQCPLIHTQVFSARRTRVWAVIQGANYNKEDGSS